MEKFNPMTVNHLLSFEKSEEIARMSKEERAQFNSDIKKQAAYFMLSVSRAVESKDYKTAKSILIYIADSCSCIDNPDAQVRYLIEVCCQHLALIQEREAAEREKAHLEVKSSSVSSKSWGKHIYVFRYNKFKGEFECDEGHRQGISQKVLFYMSKLNAILFNYQNTQNMHSLFAMLKTYYPEFVFMLILIALLGIVIVSNFVERIVGKQKNNLESHVAIAATCSLFLIPLIKIYLREPLVKDSSFFEKKLGEVILTINQECQDHGEKIKFFMPEGIEINVQIDETQPSEL